MKRIFLKDINLIIDCFNNLPSRSNDFLAFISFYSFYYQFEKTLNPLILIPTNKSTNINYWASSFKIPLLRNNFNFNEVLIKSLEAKDINEFMYKYHYIGPINHAINIGFSYDNLLIACCTFSPITRKESADKFNISPNEIKELSRFAIHPKYQKKNFASWCLSKAIKYIKINYPNLKYLISFADSTIGHTGIIYKASNWIYDGNTDESYYYLSKTGYVMHKKTLYNRAIKMKMKEKEFANKFEYIKMKTGIKYRYIYKLICKS